MRLAATVSVTLIALSTAALAQMADPALYRERGHDLETADRTPLATAPPGQPAAMPVAAPVPERAIRTAAH